MTALFLLVSVLAAAEPISEIAVITVGPSDTTVIPTVALTGTSHVLTQAEMIERLTGATNYQQVSEEELQSLRDKARYQEGYYHTPDAQRIRRLALAVYEQAPFPTSGMRRQAADIMHDLAAAESREGDRQDAVTLAIEGLSRFAEVPVDSSMHAPKAQAFFAASSASAAAVPRYTLTIVTEGSSTVWVDGLVVGNGQPQVEARVVAGRHRVWAESPSGRSLSHVVSVGADGHTLRISELLEARVSLAPVVSLRCETSCPTDLRALGQKLRVDTVLGLSMPPRPVVEVNVRTGELRHLGLAEATTPAEVKAQVVATETRPRFSPLYLIPLGVGQFAQNRRLNGAIYGGVQLGLGGVYLWAIREHDRQDKLAPSKREQDARRRENIAMVALLSSLVASVAEAVIVGLVTGAQ